MNGIDCIRATALETITAADTQLPTQIPVEVWFSPEIAGTFGPCGLGGLPGVIVSVLRNNVLIYATKVEKIKPIEIKKPITAKIFNSEAEMMKIYKKFGK